jgi:hypothetical protein
MIVEIAHFIANNVPGFVIGTNAFIGHLPLKTKAGTPPPQRYWLVLENTPAGVIGDWPDYQEKEVQIWNAAPTYMTARGDAYAVYNFLHETASKSSWPLPILTSGEAYLANSIAASASPAPILNPDDKLVFNFSTNYIFRITRI